MSEYGPVITNSYISRYYLGQKPLLMPEYKLEGIKRKPRKQYPKARSRR